MEAIFRSPVGKCERRPGLPTLPAQTVDMKVTLANCAPAVSFTSNPAAVNGVVTVVSGGSITITMPNGWTGTASLSPSAPVTVAGNVITIPVLSANSTLTITCTATAACFDIGPNGMVAWYRLDETSSAGFLQDVAGLNDRLNRFGSVTPAQGVVSGAQQFSAGGWASTTGLLTELNFGTGDFSADTWIRPDNPTAMIMHKYSEPGWIFAMVNQELRTPRARFTSGRQSARPSPPAPGLTWPSWRLAECHLVCTSTAC